jgi:hypothetical protein
VACSPEGAGDADVDGAADDEVPASREELVETGWTAGDAEASTNDTARKPRPTAAAAEAVQADPRRSVLFMAGASVPLG